MNKRRIELRSAIVLQLFVIHILIKGIHSLTMEGIIIPPYVLEGETAELRCQFRLDHDNLYSVTWYKDHEEFYRYVPKDNPKQHTYRLEGAKIDQQRSGAHIVKLKSATPAASGLYRCEVSAEAPSFTSANAEGRMDVVSLPIDGPEITGDGYPRDYREGDMLSLNCSAGRSYPPAKIQWFVNGRKVPAWYEVQGSLEGSTSSGLRLRLSSTHLADEFLVVRCVATVGSSPPPLDTRESVLFVRGSADVNKFSRCIFTLHLILLYLLLKKQ